MRALDGAANNTIAAYQTDLTGFMAFMAQHLGGAAGRGGLAKVSLSDMRAWMAQERSRGVGARSLARSLSAIKSFYRWLSEQDGFDATAVLATRSPKFSKKLPRPLAPDAAKAVLETASIQSRHGWVGARDTAVVTLLYGCGLPVPTPLCLKRCASLVKVGKSGSSPSCPPPAMRSRYIAACALILKHPKPRSFVGFVAVP